MKAKYLMSVQADHSPGLLSRVLIMLSRRRIEMESVMMSRTDINGVVMINGEIMLAASEIRNLQLQVEKIIEVHAAHFALTAEITAQKLAFFKLSTAMLDNQQSACIQKYGAQMVKMAPDSFIISKAGNDEVIRELYNKLDGKHLLGFVQTGIIADTPLLEGNDEWRISPLAA